MQNELVHTISRPRSISDQDDFLIILGGSKRFGTNAFPDNDDRSQSHEVRSLFDPSNMNKVFCSCGAIQDLDSGVICIKENLGKEIECSRCRNRRIAMNLEAPEERVSDGKGGGYLYS